jgi:hypothetical protein
MSLKRVDFIPESDDDCCSSEDYSWIDEMEVENDEKEDCETYFYSFINAAIIVLKDKKKYMTCHEIFDVIKSKNLVKTNGLTPKNTLSAILHQKVRMKTHVKKVGKRFGLISWE